jgi:hypothetical protein
MIILTVPILVRMRKLATIERFFDPILDRALGNAHLLRDGVHSPAAVTQHKHLLSLLPTSCLTPAAVPLLRSELLAEAIRLTRMVPASLPDDPEVAGPLALTTPLSVGPSAALHPGRWRRAVFQHPGSTVPKTN